MRVNVNGEDDGIDIMSHADDAASVFAAPSVARFVMSLWTSKTDLETLP